MTRLLIALLTLLAASCKTTSVAAPSVVLASNSQSSAFQQPGAAQEQDLSGVAVDVAREFWIRVAKRDPQGAIALSTYPFDLDAHSGCVASAREHQAAMDSKPIPPDIEVAIGEAKLVDGEVVELEKRERWLEKLRAFMSPSASCLDEGAVEAEEYRYVFVDFTVNGEPVGAFTRLRCRDGRCLVAGVDN